MITHEGYCRALGGKVDFNVERVVKLDTNRGIKWQVKGQYDGHNISVFTSEEIAQILTSQLDSQPQEFNAEIIWEYEEVMPYFGSVFQAEEIVEEIEIESIPEDLAPQEDTKRIIIHDDVGYAGLDSKYLKKDGSPDMRYKICREWTIEQEVVNEPESIIEDTEYEDYEKIFRAEPNDICFSDNIPLESWNTMSFDAQESYIASRDESMISCPRCETSKLDLRADSNANAECENCVFEGDFAAMHWDEELTNPEPPMEINVDEGEGILPNFLNLTIPKTTYYEIVEMIPEGVMSNETIDGASMTLTYLPQDAKIMEGIAGMDTPNSPAQDDPIVLSAEDQESFKAEMWRGSSDGDIITEKEYFKNIFNMSDDIEVAPLPTGELEITEGHINEVESFSAEGDFDVVNQCDECNSKVITIRYKYICKGCDHDSNSWEKEEQCEKCNSENLSHLYDYVCDNCDNEESNIWLNAEDETRTFRLTDITYDTYDEESETEPFYDDDGYKQSYHPEDLGLPEEGTVVLEQDEWANQQMWVLEERVIDKWSDESGWLIYGAVIEEIMPAESFEVEEKDAESLNYTERGVCDKVAIAETKKLLSQGIDDFVVIEGYVWTEDAENYEWSYPDAHTWIELKDGTIMDPSEKQYDDEGGIVERIDTSAYDIDGEFYKDAKYYTPNEFLEVWKGHIKNAESFKEWADEEGDDEEHGDNPTFEEWVDEEIEEHGDVKLSKFKEIEINEPEHYQAVEVKDAEIKTLLMAYVECAYPQNLKEQEILMNDIISGNTNITVEHMKAVVNRTTPKNINWPEWVDEEEEIYEDVEWESEEISGPKPTTIAALLAIGGLAAYFAPDKVRNFFKAFK